MPRKSLAATVAAETAPSPKSTSHSSRKSRKSLALATALDPSSPDPIAPSPEVELGRSSRKRGRKHVDEPEDLVGVLVESNGVAQPQSSGGAAEPGQEFTLEQQLEAWQDFAAEHYEMVEQLPLELHRNFRLLRELDDGCMAQTSKLEEQIRAYISARMELVKRFSAVADAIQPAADVEQPVAEGGDVQAAAAGAEGEGMEVDALEEVAPAPDAAGKAIVTDGAGKPEKADGDGDADKQTRDEGEVEAEDEVMADAPPAVTSAQPEVEARVGTTETATLTSDMAPAVAPEDGAATLKPTASGEEEPLAGNMPLPVAEAPVQNTSITAVDEVAPSDPTSDAPSAVSTAFNDTPLSSARLPPAPPMPNLPPDMGEVVPDGEGGLVVISSEGLPSSLSPRNGSSPPVEQAVGSTEVRGASITQGPEELITAAEAAAMPTDTAAAAAAAAVAEDTTAGAVTAEAPASMTLNQLRPAELPSRYLPEIGRLAREIVRNCEEKVALAVGAYNSIDRHIRALDSALSAQETSLILGLRPDTLPSAGVDQTLNLPGDTSGISHAAGAGDDEGAMVLGLGGGGGTGGRGDKRRKKKGKKVEAVPEVPVEVPVVVPEFEDADPNEPRYCYCNRVSFGDMVGCDNDDCPIEWYHLACLGLQVAPTGNWLCNECKPKIGLGMGGAGTVQPGRMEKKAGKKRKRIK